MFRKSLCGRANSDDDEPQGDSSLWILGSLYILGGLKPCGCSLATSSGSEDPLIRRVVFLSADCVDCVGSVLC
jgi:hypothetical protein